MPSDAPPSPIGPKDPNADISLADLPPAPKRKRGPKAPKPSRRPRGPPRPHRKLDRDTLDSRIAKLQKRIDRSKAQLEDAERHIDGYLKESKYRATDEPATVKFPCEAL
jgi:hypothetical protein